MKKFTRKYYIIAVVCMESLVICLGVYLILRRSTGNHTSRGLLMTECPKGWRLQVIRDGTYPAQVCRNNVSSQWMCAPHWRKLLKDPYCILADYAVHENLTNRAKPKLGSNVTKDLKIARVSPLRKIVFLQVPQSGSTFIESSFLFENPQSQQKNTGNNLYPATAWLGKESFQSYHKFCMVRHPCSRLISFWKHLSENGSHKSLTPQDVVKLKPYIHKIHTFLEFLLSPGEMLDTRNKLKLPSQAEILFDRNNSFEADRLLVYEMWNESIVNLGKIIAKDVKKLQLPGKVLNDQPKCKDVYSPSAWTRLTTLYAMDLCVFGYSTDIQETYIAPPLDWKPHILTFRFAACKKIIEERRKSSAKSQSTKIFNRKCYIYTYFQKIRFQNETRNIKVNTDTLDVWKEVWSSAGWTPVVLTEEDAKKHPEYDKFRKKFWDLPTVNWKDYEMACFLRHVAMATVGGGWLSDYDVLPLRILPCTELPNNGRYTTHERFVPSLVSGNATEFTRVANLMANTDWQAVPGEFLEAGRPHVSDMILTRNFLRSGTIQGMTSVIEARVFFIKPFQCNRMSRTRRVWDRPFSPVPPGLSLLPWAIHFSHRSVYEMLSNNITFEGIPLEPRNITRPEYMIAACKFIRKLCQFYAI